MKSQTPSESREQTQSDHPYACDWENQDEGIEFCIEKDRERQAEVVRSEVEVVCLEELAGFMGMGHAIGLAQEIGATVAKRLRENGEGT